MKQIVFGLAFAGLLAFAQGSEAAPITNCPGGLQDLTANVAVNFGGTDIDRKAVCDATFQNVEVDLTVTGRYSNPPASNNGLDTFNCGVGGDSAQGQPDFSLCNFDFHAYNDNQLPVNLRLYFDTDPAADNDLSTYGYINFRVGPGGRVQDSWNQGMGFIDTGTCIVNAYCPAAGLFNPNVSGDYGFRLDVLGPQGESLGDVAINYRVGDGGEPAPVPEPATLSLLGLGLSGAVAARRRKRSV